MIAFDTSVLVDYFRSRETDQTHFFVEYARSDMVIIIPPPVVTEILSEPKQMAQITSALLEDFEQLDILPNYWERAGKLRAKLRAAKLKAKTADALIAQFCIDHDIPLCTSDKDFKHYAKHGGLKLV